MDVERSDRRRRVGTPGQAERKARIVRGCLIGLALALLLVGGVSGTVVRHIVQIVPLVIALIVLARRPDWGAYAALPIFMFWTFVVVMIWLFLLGVSRLANGHYTTIEIGATVVMIACSIAGGATAVQLGRPLHAVGRLSAFVLFAALQLAVMWVSFLGPIANR